MVCHEKPAGAEGEKERRKKNAKNKKLQKNRNLQVTLWKCIYRTLNRTLYKNIITAAITAYNLKIIEFISNDNSFRAGILHEI